MANQPQTFHIVLTGLPVAGTSVDSIDIHLSADIVLNDSAGPWSPEAAVELVCGMVRDSDFTVKSVTTVEEFVLIDATEI